jgi:SAM-dependent methyltransferase
MNNTERHSFLRQRFDQRAGKYLRNPVTHWVGRNELKVLRSMISPPKQAGEISALDFGCGTGRVTTMLLELGYGVTGYDLSPGMLDQARAAIGDRSDVLFTSDTQALRGQWPLIVALGVLDYYPDNSPLWQEWQRLLAPDGTLLVTAPNARSPLAWLYVLFSRFTCQAYATTPEILMPVAEAAGFTLADVKFAFPRHWWGHTIVLGFQRSS